MCNCMVLDVTAIFILDNCIFEEKNCHFLAKGLKTKTSYGQRIASSAPVSKDKHQLGPDRPEANHL